MNVNNLNTQYSTQQELQETANDQIKRQAEEKQNEAHRAEAMTPAQRRLNEVLNNGAKIAAIKQAFAEEEADKKLIERERDDNLVAYLEERQKRLNSDAENRVLRQQVREGDVARIQQVEFQRQQRDSQHTQSQGEKQLNDLSRKNFEKLMEARKGYKTGK